MQVFTTNEEMFLACDCDCVNSNQGKNYFCEKNDSLQDQLKAENMAHMKQTMSASMCSNVSKCMCVSACLFLSKHGKLMINDCFHAGW